MFEEVRHGWGSAMSQRRESVRSHHRARRRALRALAAVALVAGGTVAGATAAVAATSITVTPSTGLVDGETVTVTGSGWAPGDTVYYCEAVLVDPPSSNDCGTVIKNVTADGAGNFSVPVVIERIITPFGRPPVDCAAPVQTCVFGAARLDLSGLVRVNLDFAPAPPVILPGAASVLEGNSATSNVSVPVTLSYASSATVTAQWTTPFAPGAPPGQADPGTDFTPASGTVTFAPGNTSQSVTISVNGDTLDEPDEAIPVSFSNPTNATIGGLGLGVATITNDDHATVLPGGAVVAEGNSATTNLLVPVTLSNPSSQTINVQWRTASASGPPPHADPATDFTVASGVVTFAPGETSKTVTISVNGDTAVEPDEWIVVSFKKPTNARIGGFWGLGFGVILNDD